MAPSAAHVFEDPPVVDSKVTSRMIPIDMNTVRLSPRANTKVLSGTGTSAPQIHISIPEIVSPRGSIGPQKVRNTHPFKTSIIRFSPDHGHPTPIFSKVIGRKKFANESADIKSRCGMDFGHNCVVSESPNFMNFGLLPANTRDKLKSVIFPTTRVGRTRNVSHWLRPRHYIEEVTADRVSEKKSHSNYILKSKFETTREIKDLERENISMSRPTLESSNISMSRLNLDPTPNVFNTNKGTTSSIYLITTRTKTP